MKIRVLSYRKYTDQSNESNSTNEKLIFNLKISYKLLKNSQNQVKK